jgi:hypothetical protein
MPQPPGGDCVKPGSLPLSPLSDGVRCPLGRGLPLCRPLLSGVRGLALPAVFRRPADLGSLPETQPYLPATPRPPSRTPGTNRPGCCGTGRPGPPRLGKVSLWRSLHRRKALLSRLRLGGRRTFRPGPDGLRLSSACVSQQGFACVRNILQPEFAAWLEELEESSAEGHGRWRLQEHAPERFRGRTVGPPCSGRTDWSSGNA